MDNQEITNKTVEIVSNIRKILYQYKSDRLDETKAIGQLNMEFTQWYKLLEELNKELLGKTDE